MSDKIKRLFWISISLNSYANLNMPKAKVESLKNFDAHCIMGFHSEICITGKILDGKIPKYIGKAENWFITELTADALSSCVHGV